MERQPSLLELPFLFPFAKPAAGERGCATAGSKSRERDMLHLLSFNECLCHFERQRRICSLHSFILFSPRSFTPPAAPFRMTKGGSFVQDDMVSRHVRIQPLFCALGGISSAHISTFSLTSAQANHVTRSVGHSLRAHLPCGNEMWIGTANMRLLEDAGL